VFRKPQKPRRRGAQAGPIISFIAQTIGPAGIEV
jgi:hypothetical protein